MREVLHGCFIRVMIIPYGSRRNRNKKNKLRLTSDESHKNAPSHDFKTCLNRKKRVSFRHGEPQQAGR